MILPLSWHESFLRHIIYRYSHDSQEMNSHETNRTLLSLNIQRMTWVFMMLGLLVKSVARARGKPRCRGRGRGRGRGGSIISNRSGAHLRNHIVPGINVYDNAIDSFNSAWKFISVFTKLEEAGGPIRKV